MTQSRAALLVGVVICGLTAGATPASAEVIGSAAIRGDQISISVNGRFVVGIHVPGYVCGPSTLPASTAFEIFIYDLQTSRAECVSLDNDGVPVEGFHWQPSVSADGQLVVFLSTAAGLDPRCGGTGRAHVYLRNRRLGRTDCVSLTAAGMGASEGALGLPRISATGQLVVFESLSQDLAPGDSPGSPDLFAVRLAEGAPVGPTLHITAGNGSGGESTLGFPGSVDISGSGQFVVFSSSRPDLTPGGSNNIFDVYRWELATGRIVRITRNSVASPHNGWHTAATVSADGRFIAFQSSGSDPITGLSLGHRGHVYRHDMETGQTILVSRGLNNGEANGDSSRPLMSADGRFVVFLSGASNLATGDATSLWDVFSAEFVADSIRTTLVSVATDGVTQGNGSTTKVTMSADAKVIAFAGDATNLIPGQATSGWFLARIPQGPPRLLTGAGFGGGSHVRALDARGGADPNVNFYAYERNFAGGVHVASGDVDGDGAPDLVTGAGPGGGPHVRVFSAARHTERPGDQHELASFLAYDPAFGGGVSVAVGDVTGDGIAEIITGAGAGGGPHVRVFTVDTDWATGRAGISEYTGFFAYDPGFSGGVRVATGDLDGDGIAEILTAAGRGGGPHVMAFGLSAARTAIPVVSFLAYHAGFGHGLFVTAGDLDGDGGDEIITGADAGGGPHVRAFSLNEGFSALREVSSFYAYGAAFSGGVRVASGDADGDGRADIITAPGPGMSPWVRAFRPDGQGLAREVAAFNAFSPTFGGGVFVAAPRR